MKNSRYAKGMETLNKTTQGEGQTVVDSLENIAPELGKWIVEHAYGDVISRPVLDPQKRQLATVAALAALGTASPQLKVHINGALNVGCSAEEIREVMYLMSVYAGFPAALNGISALTEVLKSRKE